MGRNEMGGMMKQDDVVDRLFNIVDKLIDRQPVDGQLAIRVTELETKLAEIEAEWPQIMENDNGTT